MRRRKRVIFSEDSEAFPVRHSDNESVNVTALEWLEAVTTDKVLVGRFRHTLLFPGIHVSEYRAARDVIYTTCHSSPCPWQPETKSLGSLITVCRWTGHASAQSHTECCARKYLPSWHKGEAHTVSFLIPSHGSESRLIGSSINCRTK
jgi:hypothetical protein